MTIEGQLLSVRTVINMLHFLNQLIVYMCILCAEILAIKIRGNTNIGGIYVTRIEHKLSQFADDTSLILDGSEKSLNEALLELDWYGKLSGLRHK